MKRKVWHWFKKNAPGPLRSILDHQVLSWAYQPTVDASESPLDKPVVVISADFELAWAWRYAEGGLANALAKAKLERAQTPRILKLLDDHQVPITWATVGLLADPKHGLGSSAPPPLPAYKGRFWSFPGGNPFAAVEAGVDLSSPDWYAPDLIENILKARTQHEIGSHSFSHHESSARVCPEAFFEWELKASAEALGRFGVKPTSFVFPGNLPGHHAVLDRNGYTAVRDFPWNREIEIALPKKLGPRLWGIHQSLCLEAYGNDPAYCGRKARHLLQKSLPHRRVISLWFHPSLDEEDFNRSFHPIVKMCANLRDKGKLEILTMKQLAHRMLGR